MLWFGFLCLFNCDYGRGLVIVWLGDLGDDWFGFLVFFVDVERKLC